MIARDTSMFQHSPESAVSLLSAIVDSSDDAIISKNLSGMVTSWNKGAERLFGYTAEEAIGRTVAELIIPLDRQDEESDILARLARGERVDHFETVRRRKDGSLVDISLTISPVKDAAGTVVGASKIARDITDAKRIRQALVDSEWRFRQLADTMPQMVWTANPDGYVDYYNERWYEFTGFTRGVFGDASWTMIFHPDDLQKTLDAYYGAIRSGQPYNLEYRLWDRRHRRWTWFIGRALPLYDSHGQIAKWFGTCTDISEQKRVEHDLRRANERLEQFAFSASHDLQESLRAIRIYSALLARRYGDKLDGEALEFLQHLCGGATRMAALVQDLLTYAETAQCNDSIELADSNEAVRAALANLSSSIAETGAQITADSLPSVPMNAAHLRQLFQNLIGNALKYRSPERIPIVHIAAHQQDAQWVFAIADNGIGIDPQYKDLIFGIFKRLHTNEQYAGTGIGLAICQRFVEQYGGQIWVESCPGEGATFRFSVPF